MKLNLRSSGRVLGLLAIVACFNTPHDTLAQQASWGNTFVSAGQIILHGNHSFVTGGSGAQPGIIKGARPAAGTGPGATSSASLGIVGFGPNGTHTGASDAAHVDGYVAKHVDAAAVQSGNGLEFTFPVGNGVKLRPVTLKVGAAGTYKAGYNAKDPAAVVGKLASGLEKISKVEYWDVDGGASDFDLTLTWDAASGLSALAGDMSRLVVAAFNTDTKQWESIGATTKTGSLEATGSIKVSGFRGGTKYVAYTFGVTGLIFKLDLTVHLEGAMYGGAKLGNMRNDLQKRGLLPTTAPYSGSAGNYSAVNSAVGPAGAVVDWIEVSIYTYKPGVDRGTKVESQSLLLRTDGKVVTPQGLLPQFLETEDSVRVVIVHRNHLPVSSHKMKQFLKGETAVYDFSGKDKQAYTFTGNQFPMRSGTAESFGGGPIEGKYCLWGGDNHYDRNVDTGDRTDFVLAYGFVSRAYTNDDLDLDGYVDANDASIHEVNFKKNVFSRIR